MMIDAMRSLELKLRATGCFDEADFVREICDSCHRDDGNGWYASLALARERNLLVLASGSWAGLCHARRIFCDSLGPLEPVTAWATTKNLFASANCSSLSAS
jgi:hypothetical protein